MTTIEERAREIRQLQDELCPWPPCATRVTLNGGVCCCERCRNLARDRKRIHDAIVNARATAVRETVEKAVEQFEQMGAALRASPGRYGPEQVNAFCGALFDAAAQLRALTEERR